MAKVNPNNGNETKWFTSRMNDNNFGGKMSFV